MKLTRLTLLLLAVAIMGTGCGSLGRRWGHNLSQSICGNNEKLGVYPGLRTDVRVVCTAPVTTVDGEPMALFFAPFFAADIAPSTVLDTCFLPWDIKENK
jgi:uncharacterized protein YceK